MSHPFHGTITLDLNDVIATFDCVEGVTYESNKPNDNRQFIPHRTEAKCFLVDCDIIDTDTGECISGIVDTDLFGEPLSYKGC